MELSWWPVAVAGFVCLAAALALAVWLPMEQDSRQLRPLANTTRLTRLPEYARQARARLLSMVAAIVLLVLLFGAAVLASARPSGWWWSAAASEAPDDIMLCVADPVTAESSGEALSYFAAQARSYGTQRIGLTSPNRRVVPLTRDYQYVAEKFGDLAGLASTPDDLPAAQQAAVRNRIASFAPPVSYTDYARSLADVLALCLTGFPSFDSASGHRRSLIYLGPGDLRAPGETRPSLFTDQRVSDLAEDGGIQINALATAESAGLRSVAESTGGQYFSVSPSDPRVAAKLDTIRAHPPQAVEPSDPTVIGRFGDAPTIPLAAAVVMSTLLCLTLVVLRR